MPRAERGERSLTLVLVVQITPQRKPMLDPRKQLKLPRLLITHQYLECLVATCGVERVIDLRTR